MPFISGCVNLGAWFSSPMFPSKTVQSVKNYTELQETTHFTLWDWHRILAIQLLWLNDCLLCEPFKHKTCMLSTLQCFTDWTKNTEHSYNVTDVPPVILFSTKQHHNDFLLSNRFFNVVLKIICFTKISTCLHKKRRGQELIICGSDMHLQFFFHMDGSENIL